MRALRIKTRHSAVQKTVAGKFLYVESNETKLDDKKNLSEEFHVKNVELILKK